MYKSVNSHEDSHGTTSPREEEENEGENEDGEVEEEA